MIKLVSFSISIIITLCLVKSENTFKDAVLEWSLQDDLSRFYDKRFGLKVKGSVPKIYQDAFHDLKNVTVIDVSNTKLQEIQPGALQHLPKLKYIDVSNNNLRELKSGVFANLTIDFIELKNNNIRTLENGAFQNSSIESLCLHFNKIEQLGKDVFENSSLNTILIAHNSISKLEAGIFDRIKTHETWPSLTLMFQYNKLEEIDPEVFNDERIGFLALDNNRISKLRPGDLGNMYGLYNFNVSCNKLTEIPEGVFTYGLRYIDVSYNEISTIASKAFDGIHSLLKFKISHNRLKTFDSTWFRKSLTDSVDVFLHFDDNLIEEIPSEAFKDYQNVKILDFRRNRIEKVASDAFRGTKRIEFLMLSENSIQKWNESALIGRNDLKISGLDLRKNKLKCFDRELDEIFAPVKNVWLDGNPISANCIEKIQKSNKTVTPIEMNLWIFVYDLL